MLLVASLRFGSDQFAVAGRAALFAAPSFCEQDRVYNEEQKVHAWIVPNGLLSKYSLLNDYD